MKTIGRNRTERRLAADMAGYSRLIGADEEGTLSNIRSIRAEVIDLAIAAHRGRLVKTTGDGLLVEFGSVVEALRCAVHIQHHMADRNADVPPADRIEFRIGIHMGDVVVEDGDIFGDAVNMAARLEGLAEAGGICVSARVQEDAAGRLDIPFEDLGERQLKNIARPILVYAIRRSLDRSTPNAHQSAGSTAELSIVVLPFVNLSHDPEQEYFADAITDDLTTDLSRMSGSLVISRNTAFTYKGKAADAKQIGRDLAVRYLLEGSVRRAGENVRINLQLIETKTAAHVWAERFDISRADLDQTQEEITSRLAHTLNRELVVAAFRRIEHQSGGNPNARDLAMCGWAWWHRPTSISGRQQARHAFEMALGLDPKLIDAKIGLAATVTQILVEGWSSDFDEDQQLAERLLREVLQRDANHAMARAQMALLRRVQNRLGGAQTEAELAITIDPNNEIALKQLGQILLFQGEPAAGLAHLEKAIRLNPRGPNLWSIQWPLGQCHLLLGHVDEAVGLFRKACAASPDAYYLHLNLAGALGLRGDLAEARTVLGEALRLNPQVNSLARYRARTPWITNARHWALREETLNAGLRRAGFADE